MKKWILMLMVFSSVSCLKAQEVFNTILEKATSVVNSEDRNDYNTKISYFYYTELNYMKYKAKASYQAGFKILDEQAYAMQEFVTDFFKQMAMASDDKRKNVITVFINASLENPLFDDKDTETTQSFISDPEYITPFSLDTDWVAAHKAAKKTLKKM